MPGRRLLSIREPGGSPRESARDLTPLLEEACEEGGGHSQSRSAAALQMDLQPAGRLTRISVPVRAR